MAIIPKKLKKRFTPEQIAKLEKIIPTLPTERKFALGLEVPLKEGLQYWNKKNPSKMKGVYLIIQTGYEGIESLLWLTDSIDEARTKTLSFKAEVTEQNLKDQICVQKWNGKEFHCACSEVGVEPSKRMLR